MLFADELVLESVAGDQTCKASLVANRFPHHAGGGGRGVARFNDSPDHKA